MGSTKLIRIPVITYTHSTQDGKEDRVARGALSGKTPLVLLDVHGHDRSPLPQVRATDHTPGLFSGSLYGRQQNCHEQGNDRNNHEQLNERESKVIGEA